MSAIDTATTDHAHSYWSKLWQQPSVRIVALILATLTVLLYRRADQFTHPYVWVEDGTENLVDFIRLGWGFVFDPIVGYIIVPIRIIFGLAATISFRWLPEILVVLTFLFTVFVLAAIALSPTYLKRRFLCALAVLLIPIKSEVYGVSLYAGWWGTLLAVLPLLWLPNNKNHALRASMLILGGLSTPTIVAMAPLYIIRACLLRRKAEFWLTVLCIAVACIQIGVMAGHSSSNPTTLSPSTLLIAVEKFLGLFVYWDSALPNSELYSLVGWLFALFLVVACTLRKQELGWPFLALVSLFVIFVGLSAFRVPVESMHPIMAGPRYFFYPYIALSWVLLYLIDRKHLVTSTICVALLVAPLRTTALYARQSHQPIDWRAEIAQCVASTSHNLPINYIGNDAPHLMWNVVISGESCRALVRGSLMDNALDSTDIPQTDAINPPHGATHRPQDDQIFRPE